MKWCFLRIVLDVIVLQTPHPCSPEIDDRLPVPPVPGAVIAKRQLEDGCIVSYRTTIIKMPADWRGV